jgi:hypothetical protein
MVLKRKTQAALKALSASTEHAESRQTETAQASNTPAVSEETIQQGHVVDIDTDDVTDWHCGCRTAKAPPYGP